MSKVISIKIKPKQPIKFEEGPSLEELNQIERELPSDEQSLYLESFFKYVMNNHNSLNEKKYNTVKNFISPILSLKFTEVKKKSVRVLIENYLKIKPDDSLFLSKLDEVSKIDHIFKFYFDLYADDKATKGFDEALDLHQDFYFMCEELYIQIPICFVFSLINVVEGLND